MTRRERRRECHGKIRYLSGREAHTVARRMRRQFPGVMFQHYPCSVCGFFHVGSVSPVIARRKREAVQEWRGLTC